MKDRVDNFLKVASERISNDIENNESRYHLNDLMGSLMSLIEDKEEQDRFETEYNKIIKQAQIAEWDRRSLEVIAGEREVVGLDRLDRLTHQVTQGRMKQRMGQGVPVLNGTLAQNAVWTNSQANLEKELQELKDEIRANRYKTP